MNRFLKERNGETFQSVPVVVFFTRDFVELHRYIERPEIYRAERLHRAMQRPKAGETKDEAWSRFMEEWKSLQRDTPFFAVWASAAIDEMLSALYETVSFGGTG